jgi:hypothetical protein
MPRSATERGLGLGRRRHADDLGARAAHVEPIDAVTLGCEVHELSIERISLPKGIRHGAGIGAGSPRIERGPVEMRRFRG